MLLCAGNIVTGSDVQTDAVIEVTTNDSIRPILFSFTYILSYCFKQIMLSIVLYPFFNMQRPAF
jgi:hypothetical protein